MADRSIDTDQGNDTTFNDGAMASGRVRIIVIDTLTNILGPILAGSVTQGRGTSPPKSSRAEVGCTYSGQAEIHALMEGLQDMVRRYDLLAIVSSVHDSR